MFDSYVTFQARLRPNALAVMAPQRWATYAELEKDIDRLATGLRGLGLTPASGVVAIQVGDDYLRHLTLLALCRLGITSACANDAAADLRLNDHDEGADPKLIPLTASWLTATLAAEVPPVVGTAGAGGAIGRVMLSSGTTAASKRIALSFRMIDSNARASALSYAGGKAGRWVAYTGMDSMIGMTLPLAAWLSGATAVVGMTGDILAEQLDSLSPTLIAMAPIHLSGLLRALPARFPFQPGLRLVIGGALMSPALAAEARLRLTGDLKIAYGATETGLAVVGDATLAETNLAYLGSALPGVSIEIVDEAGLPVSPGQSGELRIRGERVAKGYLDDPEATAARFRDDSFYPGDLGHLLPDGQIALEGRKDDRMNLGGIKFLPNLLEDVALTCPGVDDCAAFSVPDADGIDHCWLAVVQREGFEREHLTRIIAAEGSKLPPVRFAWSEVVPRNAMGKIERDRLRQVTMAALAKANPR